MARIEVLRGPQGTLYGASSLGGVIKYVANQPSRKGSRHAYRGPSKTSRGGHGLCGTGVVNIPIGDTFAVRASGFYRSNDGYIDSIGNNPIPACSTRRSTSSTAPASKATSTTRVIGGRLSALFAPSEMLAGPHRAYQNINSDNDIGFEVRSRYARTARRQACRLALPLRATDIEYQLYSATLDWDFGGVSLAVRDQLQRVPAGIPARPCALDPGCGFRTCAALDPRLHTPAPTDALLSGDPEHGHRQVHPGVAPGLAGERQVRVALGRLLHRRGFASIQQEILPSRPARTPWWPTFPSSPTSRSSPPTRRLRCSRMRPGTSATGSISRSALAGATTTRKPPRSSRHGFRFSIGLKRHAVT